MNQERIEFSGRIYRMGCQYLDAADLLLDHGGFIYPALVNYAFSCELFLKSAETTTHILHGKREASSVKPVAGQTYVQPKRKGTHSLLRIFQLLQPDDQGILRSYFMKTQGKDLESLLTKYKGYFMDQRYAFEQTELQLIYISELRELADGLKNAIPLITTPIEKPSDEFKALVNAEIKSRR